jgi:methionyl-tRNA formyltransferase
MLPELVWNMPPMGTINVHASLLPKYRGAAPINWAIIHGETETGITTFKLQHEIDTGNILLQSAIAIGADENAGGLHDRLKILGAGLLVETITQLAGGQLAEIGQPATERAEQQFPHAPKLDTASGEINWHQPVVQVYNLIRGLSPYPAAHTLLNGKLLKIYAALQEITTHDKTPGEIFSDGKSFLKFATPNGYIHLTDLQLAGKKRMPVADFLRGYHFTKNEIST